MALRTPRRPRPIRVALSIADRALRARVAEACEDAGIPVADPDAAIDDAGIVLSDHPVETAAHVIALASSRESAAWPDDVRGIVPADIDAATLCSVIAVVAAGLVVMPRDDVTDEEESADEEPGDAKIATAWADPIDGPDELPIVLTPREREVLALLAAGATNKAIARALAVSVHTAKFHVASLTAKLGARSRLEATAIAIRAGLVMV